MRRYCQLIGLRPEVRDEYIRHHADVWPTVLATIEACNIRNYSIYLYNDFLIAYFEYHGTDYKADMRRMAADPETQRWWAIMDPMQQPPPGVSTGHRWLEITEVFHFDGAPIAAGSSQTGGKA
ncbi:MAG TPA: L-rhamnose mutarotase [Acidobacteriaceae bacterium]|jgi:L-rhamnose mutarotase|nr:L-rhamnose mutarotase [Acidobacteriaceae bacterium]